MPAKAKKEKTEDKGKKNIDAVLAKLQKAHGSDIIFTMGSGKITSVETISTGSFEVDKALRIGGLPRGRVIELYGEPSGGKTTVALNVLAEAQRKKLRCAFVDAECALDLDLVSGVGVNPEDLILVQPEYGEQGLTVVKDLAASGELDVIVVDSVAALVPLKELEGEMEDMQVGLQARMMTKALRKMTKMLADNKVLLIFINQTRVKIGLSFGDPTDTPGGKALKFFSSIRMDVRRIGSVKHGKDNIIGNRVKITVVKNKLAPPYGRAEVDLIFGKGFNKEGEILDIAAEANIVDRNGAWYSYDDDRLGQGRPDACEFLRKCPDILNKIIKEIEVESC